MRRLFISTLMLLAAAACETPNSDARVGAGSEGDDELASDVQSALRAFASVEVLAVQRGVPTFVRGELGRT